MVPADIDIIRKEEDGGVLLKFKYRSSSYWGAPDGGCIVYLGSRITLMIHPNRILFGCDYCNASAKDEESLRSEIKAFPYFSCNPEESKMKALECLDYILLFGAMMSLEV